MADPGGIDPKPNLNRIPDPTPKEHPDQTESGSTALGRGRSLYTKFFSSALHYTYCILICTEYILLLPWLAGNVIKSDKDFFYDSDPV